MAFSVLSIELYFCIHVLLDKRAQLYDFVLLNKFTNTYDIGETVSMSHVLVQKMSSLSDSSGDEASYTCMYDVMQEMKRKEIHENNERR